MVTSFVLLLLAPAAPVPKAPAPAVEVTAKPYSFPAQPGGVSIDDGLFVEVTIKNTSKDVIAVPYMKRFREPIHVRVTNEKGAIISDPKRHLGFRRVNEVPKRLDLLPGDSFSVVVHLEDNWDTDADRRKPGKYTARIVFDNGTVRAESTRTFEVEITK